VTAFIIIIHVVASLFLISIVLLQSGKGAEMGAAFGGSSQTLFGSRGAATFLNKLTTVAAVVFMLTSLTLTMVTTKKSSIIQQTAPADQRRAIPQQQAPQAPQQQPIPQQPLTK
jgi:preprotein translocase subunit SecG